MKRAWRSGPVSNMGQRRQPFIVSFAVPADLWTRPQSTLLNKWLSCLCVRAAETSPRLNHFTLGHLRQLPRQPNYFLPWHPLSAKSWILTWVVGCRTQTQQTPHLVWWLTGQWCPRCSADLVDWLFHWPDLLRHWYFTFLYTSTAHRSWSCVL